MTMIDLTPWLMGDPSTALRRPPTAAEAERAARMAHYEPKHDHRVINTRLTKICALVPIRGTLEAKTEAEARAYCQWFYQRDKHASIKKQSPTLWLVTRLR